MVEKITKSNKIIYKLLFADDGAYEGNEVLDVYLTKESCHCIKVGNNARVKLKTGHILRNLSVMTQKNNLQKWKDSIVSYGKSWIVETVFLSIKRMFGEYVYSAVRLKNMIEEMMLKASLYNKFASF